MSQLPKYLTITNQPSEALNELIGEWKPDKVAFLVDENTRASCLPLLSFDSEVIEIKSGEESKTLKTCELAWEALTNHQFTRKSLLVNLGGGVIGDLGGFVASTFKRGMRFVNLPTTLLSQVDASIGGKLGVDFQDLKNHIGIFRDPDQVIVSTKFLETLPEREMKSGFAEVIKHALISDASQWQLLVENGYENLNWEEIIPKSISIKNQVVLNDPFEAGLRKILNFGHTLGHAIESVLLKTPKKLLHGEAIAVGMILESHLSLQRGSLTQIEFDAIKNFIASVFTLPKEIPDLEELNAYMLQDKKNDSNGVSFSLLNGIGNCDFDITTSTDMIKKSLSAYEDLI